MREPCPIAAEPGVRDSTQAASEGRGSPLPLARATEGPGPAAERSSPIRTCPANPMRS
jgi:hypothetical protein